MAESYVCYAVIYFFAQIPSDKENFGMTFFLFWGSKAEQIRILHSFCVQGNSHIAANKFSLSYPLSGVYTGHWRAQVNSNF